MFLPDFISTAVLENHCKFIPVGIKAQSFRYFVTGIEFWVENGWYLALQNIFRHSNKNR